MATEDTIADLLLGALEAQDYGVPVAMPDIAFAVPTGDDGSPLPYLVVNLQFNNHGVRSNNIGGKIQRMGFLQISVMYPKNGGVINSLALAGQVRDAWPRGTHFVRDDLKVVISDSPTINGPFEDQTRTQVPVVIPWQGFESA